MKRSFKYTERKKINKNINKQNFFICSNCGIHVPVKAIGTSQRNHCPYCLWSIHVDLKPGDRQCFCKGLMEPISIWIRDDNECSIIHRCRTCGILKTNRIAGDDNNEVIIELLKKPLHSINAIEKINFKY